jgi:predicted esterase
MDGARRPYAVCVTSDSPDSKPVVIIVSPGAPTDAGPEEIHLAEQYAWFGKKNGKELIAVRATGRGPGSVYQNYGELDVLEDIDDLAAKYPVDRDRIGVTGFSMGGAATWYLASHYPDLFASGAPGSGYCDYRFWQKPGGYTYPLQPWEIPSWQARSAAFLIDNFRNTPMWIYHGAWDRSIGGGVPVAISREMYSLLREKKFEVQYTESPNLGHRSPPDTAERFTLWQIQQKKERHPKHVSLVTYELRHNRNYWVTIDQIERYGARASIDAALTDSGLTAKTQNVRGFSLGPIPDTTAQTVRINGQAFAKVDLTNLCSFKRTAAGKWESGKADLTGQKRHGSSGPLTDIYFDNLILVPGTVGTEEDTHFNQTMATNTASLFMSENGGLHRGGIRGSNTIKLPVVNDVDLKDDQVHDCNLLLFGTDKSNAVLRKYAARLNVGFTAKAVRVGDKTYPGEGVAVFVVLPHPDNPRRYFAVLGGDTPDAIAGASHMSLQLLPDYLVFTQEKMLDWGFWDNAWKHLQSWQTHP